MRFRMIAVSIVSLFVAGMFFALPVAAGPTSSNGDSTIQVGSWIMIVTKRGWRQWTLDADENVYKFANVLFAEGMKEEAIAAHVADGWTFNDWTVKDGSDLRYEHVSDGDLDGDGIVAIIFKAHDIPAGS